MNTHTEREILNLLEMRRLELDHRRQHEHLNPLRKPVNDPTETFAQFDILRGYPGFQVTDECAIEENGQRVKLIFANTSRLVMSKNGSHHAHDMICFAAFPLKSDPGRTIIRAETILDKIADFFSRADIDFDEYPDFSSKYGCYSNDAAKLKMALTPETAKVFTGFAGDLCVEFGFGYCVIHNGNSVYAKEAAVEIVDIALQLRKVLR